MWKNNYRNSLKICINYYSFKYKVTLIIFNSAVLISALSKIGIKVRLQNGMKHNMKGAKTVKKM
jgi:hypothetical protein